MKSITPERAGGHEGIHRRNGFLIRLAAETPREIPGQHRGGQHGGEISKAMMREGRVPGEKDEGHFVDLPFVVRECSWR